MLIAPLSQLSLYLLMWFSSIQVPLLVCWASHQYLQRLKFTASEDAAWPRNKSNKSLTKFSTTGGPGRSVWQGGTCLAALLSWDLGCSKEGEGRCSGASPLHPRQQPEPLQTLPVLGHLRATCCRHAPYLTNSSP